jgi:hypothetical protein
MLKGRPIILGLFQATNSANYTDFVVKKHWQYPFSYWARYYWNKPPGGGGR